MVCEIMLTLKHHLHTEAKGKEPMKKRSISVKPFGASDFESEFRAAMETLKPNMEDVRISLNLIRERVAGWESVIEDAENQLLFERNRNSGSEYEIAASMLEDAKARLDSIRNHELDPALSKMRYLEKAASDLENLRRSHELMAFREQFIAETGSSEDAASASGMGAENALRMKRELREWSYNIEALKEQKAL